MKKLFTSDKFFLVAMLLAVVGQSLLAIHFLIDGKQYLLSSAFSILAAVGCCITLFVSYQKHAKNVMKGAIGALLMAILLDSFSYISSMGNSVINSISTPIYIFLALALLVNHFLINEKHTASPRNVAINRILVCGIAIIQFIWTATFLANSSEVLYSIFQIGYMIGFPSMCAVIVCVESRLDAYRLDREAAGWTEEKGYPENYVHEYEKKDDR